MPGAVQAQNDAVCVGGKPIAPLKIEVFSDYQCPACREFYLTDVRDSPLPTPALCE